MKTTLFALFPLFAAFAAFAQVDASGFFGSASVGQGFDKGQGSKGATGRMPPRAHESYDDGLAWPVGGECKVDYPNENPAKAEVASHDDGPLFDKLDLLSGGKALEAKWIGMKRLLEDGLKDFQELSDIAESGDCSSETRQLLVDYGEKYVDWMKAYGHVDLSQRNRYELAQLSKAFGDAMSAAFKAVDKTGLASVVLDGVNSSILLGSGEADASTVLSLLIDMADLDGKLNPVTAKILGIAIDAYNVIQDFSKIAEKEKEYYSNVPNALKAKREMEQMIPEFKSKISELKARSFCPVRPDQNLTEGTGDLPSEADSSPLANESGYPDDVWATFLKIVEEEGVCSASIWLCTQDLGSDDDSGFHFNDK